MDYKDTLHMPKTSFEMRGNLTKKEPGFQKRWQDEKLYEKMLERHADAENYVLHDGPPYANGDIHLGHALNKIQVYFFYTATSCVKIFSTAF